MRWLLFVALVVITSFATAAAHDDLIIKKNAALNELLLQILVTPGFDEDALEAADTADVGKQLCSEYGGSSCYSVRSIADAICRVEGGCGFTPVRSIADAICRVDGGCGFTPVRSISDAICRIGSGCGFSPVRSIGEAICKVGKGSNCYSVNSTRDGLNRISTSDRYWYWDKFYDAYDNLIWRCRGSQTGQFAENEKCSGQTKDDERWPNK